MEASMMSSLQRNGPQASPLARQTDDAQQANAPGAENLPVLVDGEQLHSPQVLTIVPDYGPEGEIAEAQVETERKERLPRPGSSPD